MLDPKLPLIKADGYVDPNELAGYKRHGFAAINYQAQNDTNLVDYELSLAKNAGLSPGVWGVTYHPLNFFRDGQLLGKQAMKLGAEHVTMDVESALKNTRQNKGAKPIIDGVRSAGWTGPIHLNTLGGPQNPRTAANPAGNDYQFDYQSFLDTGGGVFLQCYFNMADEYRPEPSIEHAKVCGVPADRLNVTISLAYSEPYAPKPIQRINGAGWVPLLAEAEVKKNLSIFLARSIQAGDLDALDVFTLQGGPVVVDPTPIPQPKPLGALATRQEIVRLAQDWENRQQKPVVMPARIPILRVIASTTDPQWDDVGQKIEDILSDAGLL